MDNQTALFGFCLTSGKQKFLSIMLILSEKIDLNIESKPVQTTDPGFRMTANVAVFLIGFQ